jgi:hypothetical protein
MALDFPISPSIGQLYPSPPVVGQPVYKWDGEKWAVSASGGVIYAPFDAMAYSGLQINGSMDVSQENGAGAVVVVNNSKYVVDGMVLVNLGATGSITASQTAITSLPGFPNCLTLQCTIANPISGAGDAVYVYQSVEGYRWSRLAFGSVSAQPVTISFWVLPPISGTMAVSIRGGGYSYVVDVPVTGGFWQYKTVTIPGNVAGTWNVGNTAGATLSFCFGSGSSRKAAGNTWLAVDAIATAATTNFFAATGVVYLSGVTVIPGTQAPTAAQSPNVMRPYDQELVTCKRYFQKMTCVVDVAVAGQSIFLAPEMRVIPTFTGGGTGFTINGPSAISPFVYQATRALTTLTMDARL